MKQLNTLLGILLFCCTSFVSPASINGRFTVINATSSDFTVLLQINADAGSNDLGGSTIVFGFDTTAINFTESPVKDVDYIFHNFSGGNYSSATVTRPMKNKIWVNIDLPFNSNNNGTAVAVSPEWTDVLTIHFDVVDPGESPNLSWHTTSPFWGIYDADNSTLWETGVFEDFPTSVEPGSDLPVNFELSQNYPNPFNPSTKIRYTIPSVIAGGLPAGKAGTEQSQLVTLKVYDVLGNEIATLVDEEKEPGNYEVEFLAANLASGIYIYRLHSSEFSDIKKMILLK